MQNLKLKMIKCTLSSSYRSVGASLAWFKKFPVMKGWSVEEVERRGREATVNGGGNLERTRG